MIRRALLATLIAGPALGASLKVEVHGALPDHGQLLVSLFASEAAWLRTPVRDLTVPVDADGQARFSLDDLAPGVYGLSIIYDEDRDGALDVNLLGIPTEGFGFSNNARALIGPPGWEAVKFRMNQDQTALRIRLDRAD